MSGRDDALALPETLGSNLGIALGTSAEGACAAERGTNQPPRRRLRRKLSYEESMPLEMTDTGNEGAELCLECGNVAVSKCTRCAAILCMDSCGTQSGDHTYCEGCDPKPRRVMHKSALPPGSACGTLYKAQVKLYKDRATGLKELGGNQRFVGHGARVRKVDGNLTYLRCNLSKSNPPCQWVRLLSSEGEQGATLWQMPGIGVQHCCDSHAVGIRGVADLQERHEIEKKLQEAAYTAPKAVFRSRRLTSEAAAKIELKDVQNMK